MRRLSIVFTGVLLAASSLVSGCSLEWDRFEYRDDAGPIDGAGGAGGTDAGAGTGGTGGEDETDAGAGSGGTDAGGGTGGSGGMDAGGGTGGTGGDAGPEDAGDCSDASALPDGSCKSNTAGVYAAKIVADVYWIPAGDLLLLSSTDPGRGKISFYVRGIVSDVCANGELQVEIVPCGIEMPPVTSLLLCEYHLPVVPDSVWDSPSIAPVIVNGSVTSFGPGGVLSIPATTFLYGIDLTNPDATWPTADQTDSITCAAGTGEPCFPDYEGDGNPGISATFTDLGSQAAPSGCGLEGSTPFTYGAAALSVDPLVLFPGSNVAKAGGLFVGARLRSNGGATIGDDCESGWRKVTVENFDIRLWSCVRAEGSGTPPATANQECSAAEADFMDSHLPLYIPLNEGEIPPSQYGGTDVSWPSFVDRSQSKGAVSYIQRVAGPGTVVNCQEIRDAADAAEAALHTAAGF